MLRSLNFILELVASIFMFIFVLTRRVTLSYCILHFAKQSPCQLLLDGSEVATPVWARKDERAPPRGNKKKNKSKINQSFKPFFLNFFFIFYLFIFFVYFFKISWRLITLQYCSGFCHTLTWISLGYACIPHPVLPLPPPSPPNPSGSSQCTRPEHLTHASNLGWWSVSP